MQLRELAVQMSWSCFLKALEERGIAMDAEDEYGWNAFQLARYHGTNSSLFGKRTKESHVLPPRPSRLRPRPLTKISKDGLEVTTGTISLFIAIEAFFSDTPRVPNSNIGLYENRKY